MPQIDLKYSNDLMLEPVTLFTAIEKEINQHDANAGLCKSRAYVSEQFLHQHVFLQVQVLNKPHRDDAWMRSLSAKLVALLKPQLPEGYQCAVALGFTNEYYQTFQI